MIAPNDTELQRMTDKQLADLWARRPKYPVSASALDWVRVAKEVRHRERFTKKGVSR